MNQSVRYRIGAALVAAMRAAAGLSGVVIKRNPLDPAPLRDGSRVIFFEDQADGYLDQAAQIGKRIFSFAIGVISRDGTAPDATADADYVAAEDAIRGAYPALAAALQAAGAQIGPLRERQVTYKSDDLDVGGALVLGSFEVEYLRPKAPR